MSTDDDDDATMDGADLSMMQLSDSFFPTGMYSMSNGLEAIFYSYGSLSRLTLNTK
jgi:urease accessory protein